MSIRLAGISDLEAMLSIYGPYVTDTAVSFEYSVPTLEEFTHRFTTITAQFPWLVWEEEGQVLGYAYGSAPFTRPAYAWCAAVSIYLAPQAQRRGIGKALYAALEKVLICQGYQVAYAIVTTQNEASRTFHEAAGYRLLATFPDCGYKLGRWYGIMWLEKRLSAVEIPSNPPIPVSDIVNIDRNFL